MKARASTSFARPTKFGGTGPRIVVAFGGRRADDFAGNIGVDPIAQAGFESFLHTAVLAGVEREDGDASAWIETGGEISQKVVERREFVVHGDAQCLEDATDGFIALLVGGRAQQGAVDGMGQRGRGGKRMTRENIGQNPGMGFVGVFRQESGESIGADFFQQRAGRLAALRVHAHVERALELDREAAVRIVDLHRGHAEISEDQVDSGKLFKAENFRQPGKIAAMRHENFRAESTGAQSRLGFWEFDGINVQPDETSAGLQFGKKFASVTAVTQGAIHGRFARLRKQRLENLRDHNGPVRARGCFAGSEHFGDGVGVTLGVAFLVFLLESPRIFSGVTRSPSVRRRGDSFRRRCVAHDSLYFTELNRQSGFEPLDRIDVPPGMSHVR